MTTTTAGFTADISRLDNWARWSREGVVSLVMSHYYRNKAAVVGEYVRRKDDDESGAEDDHMPVDEIDAIEVERILHEISPHLRNAVMLFFLGRTEPMYIYRLKRIPEDVLRELVSHAAIAIENC